MSTKDKKDSEVSRNQIWREAIHRETMALRKQKTSYSCNLSALSKERITDPPGRKVETRMVLSPEQDAEAAKILEQYGHKTTVEDPLEIRVPRTSNLAYGLFNAYSLDDPRRSANNKRACEETTYGQNYFKMAGKSAFSNKV